MLMLVKLLIGMLALALLGFIKIAVLLIAVLTTLFLLVTSSVAVGCRGHFFYVDLLGSTTFWIAVDMFGLSFRIDLDGFMASSLHWFIVVLVLPLLLSHTAFVEVWFVDFL